MVEDAHQVVVLVSSSSDLLALIHCGLLLLVALLYRGRTLGQSVRNTCLAVPALVVETCLQALDASLAKPEEDGHRCVTSGNERLCNRLTAHCGHARIAVRSGLEVTTDRVARAVTFITAPPSDPTTAQNNTLGVVPTCVGNLKAVEAIPPPRGLRGRC